MNFHSYEPKTGHGLRHDPFNAIVGPRPIGWISTLSRDGTRNLAPYSFFNAFNYTPPIIGFSSTQQKDTARNIAETGEFVWNLVTRPLAEAMNATSTIEPVDEFVRAGLETTPSAIVKPPRVATARVAFECRLTQQFNLRDAEGNEMTAIMTFGEVVCIHIDRALLADGVYHTAAADPVLRGGGAGDYFPISDADKFVMIRPK